MALEPIKVKDCRTADERDQRLQENQCQRLLSNIREEFVDFIMWKGLLSKAVLTKYDLDCRGQGYDGATNMSGPNGVHMFYKF